MAKNFKLSDLQIKALQSMTDISEINSYGWKNLNVLRLAPSETYEEGNTSINFDLSSALLAGNIPLNRVQMVADIEVTCSGKIGSSVAYTNTNLTTAITQIDNEGLTPYVFSVSNSGLDSLCLNKAFSNVQLTVGTTQTLPETRTPERLDILTRLLSQENLRESGVYPDDNTGLYETKGGQGLELISLQDPINFIPQVFAHGCDQNSILTENLFWKRNTNKQYIVRKKYPTSTTMYAEFNDGAGWVNSDPTRFAAAYTNYYYMSEANENLGTINYWYEAIPLSITPPVASIQQRQIFTVYEDLIHDLFTSKYSNTVDYKPLPVPQMQFSFNISPNINNLFKVSNNTISSVNVVIKNMYLNVLTFNFGALDIIPRPYFVPYYNEKQNIQALKVLTTDITTTPTIAPVQYNSMPTWLLIYANEQVQTDTAKQNKSMNLNITKMNSIKITINNDGGKALFNKNIDELKQNTLANLNDDLSNVNALFRNRPNPCEGMTYLLNNIFNGSANPAVTDLNILTMPQTWDSKPYLDGLFLLRIDRDIRLNETMMASLNTPTVFNFEITFSNQYNKYSASQLINFTTVAFFPGYYQVSPTEGILKVSQLTTTEQQFLEMLNNTNNAISTNPAINNVEYTKESPLMLGSGWFGSLASNVGKMASIIPKGMACVSAANDVRNLLKRK